MIRKIRKLILYAGAALMATSCIVDKTDYDARPNEKISSVRFTLSVPGVATPRPSSRSLSDAQEEAVSSVDVLVFYTSGDHSGKLFRREKGTHVSGNTFEVKLPEGTYDLVVLGNATSIIDGTSGLVPLTTAKADAVASLLHTNTGYWTATTIPMWGYKDGVVVDETTMLTGSDAIDMHRMVAKIEVQIATAAAGTNNDNFALKSVRLYNYNTKGRLAPDMANFNPTGGIVNAGKGIATDPTVPSDRGAVTGVNNPLVFEAAQGVTANDFKNTIYTFEAAKGTALTLEDNPCLVIGGSYDKGTETFYRVDFVQKSGETVNYLDLLRNHRYLVSVNSVTGKGHETPEEAFNSRSFNIEVSTLQWEEGGLTGMVFDGQNFLGVSQDAFELTRESRGASDTDNKLQIRTDVSTGWTAAVWNNLAGTVAVVDDGTTGNPWLRISPTSGDGADNSLNTMTLEMDANESGADRTAYIHIKAGRLNYIVKVVQKYLYLKITDLTSRREITTLSFNSKTSLIGTDPQPRQIMVEWSPATENVTVNKTAGTTDLTWQTSYSTTLTGGRHVLTIDPKGITQAEVTATPYISKTAKLTFTLGTTSTTADLDIDQSHYALSAANFTAITAAVLSGTGSVKSNAPWSATWTTNLSAGSMTIPSTQPITDAGSTAGVNFPYTFSSGSDGSVTFTFAPTDPSKDFDPVTVSVDAIQLPTVNPGMTGPGTPIFDGRIYVGAFWRNDQRGERLIRIPVDAASRGKWAVQILDEGGFAADDIMFEQVEYDATTKAYTYTPSAPVADPAGNDTPAVANGESYLIGETTAAYSSGAMTAANSIYFRVGLKTTNPGSAPRYARIIISCGTSYGTSQVLWLRQGEGDDYIFGAPGDPAGTRTGARKFSPYNTTSQYLDDSANPYYYQVNTTVGGDFTKYPSQAGAFFQFAQRVNPNYAYHPTAITTAGNQPWNFDMTNFDPWSDPAYNTCPDGYTRPTGGALGEAAATFPQSLLDNPAVDGVTNSTWGYYADGFFDRLDIDANSVTSTNTAHQHSSVRGTKYDAAYRGRLFFNNSPSSNHHNASVFFPAAGYRKRASQVEAAGEWGEYWTASSPAKTLGYQMWIHQATVYGCRIVSRDVAGALRCVAE